MNLFVRDFEWDPEEQPNGNVQHITKHNVTPVEAEEVFEFPEEVLIRKTRQGYRLAYGRTAAGRYLLVVFVLKQSGVVRVITARDMNQAERRYYRSQILS
ncbi:MAG: BrnT family toxin [Bacillota bacterium]